MMIGLIVVSPEEAVIVLISAAENEDKLEHVEKAPTNKEEEKTSELGYYAELDVDPKRASH
jgi:hypothetical protein